MHCSAQLAFKLLFAAVCFTSIESIAAADDDLFERRVRPVLVETCLPCHGGKETRGDLRVDSRQSLLTGGERGPAIIPKLPEQSLLLQAIRHTNGDLAMPPAKRLRDDVIADIGRWIEQGANWPENVQLTDSTADHQRQHWSFQSLVKFTDC